MTIKQAALQYPCFSEGSLRWMWFNAEKSGFAAVVCKVGKKILIKESKLIEWIESQSASV